MCANVFVCVLTPAHSFFDTQFRVAFLAADFDAANKIEQKLIEALAYVLPTQGVDRAFRIGSTSVSLDRQSRRIVELSVNVKNHYAHATNVYLKELVDADKLLYAMHEFEEQFNYEPPQEQEPIEAPPRRSSGRQRNTTVRFKIRK